jgi:2-octaprenyl-6-methoxyphenol hydroxylase
VVRIPQRVCLRSEPAVKPEFDILILGGGLVGSSLACALEGRGYRIGLVEASLPSVVPPGFDERKLALAAASVNALTALGVLSSAALPSPLRRIHVSSAGDFGVVRLEASDTGRESFGGVVTARELGLALERRLATLADLRLLRPETVTGVQAQDDLVTVRLRREQQERLVTTRLLVAADGTRSFARGELGIATEEHDYQQTLLVCSIATDRAADGTAYERFTRQGPVALLPMGHEYGAICAVPGSEAEAIMAMDDAGYASYFQGRFGWRAGRVERVGRRSAYPIVRVLAQRLVGPRTILMGNAAQTIHPIGAQGFNLGLRDALTLAELLDDADPGSADLLGAYVEARSEDRRRTLAFSDGLARSTANPSLPMQVMRSFGLMALAHVPGLSSPLVAGAMGFRGRVPRLARGIR